MANRCVAGLGEAEDGVSNGMARVRQSKLPFSFPHHAGLFFDRSVTLLCDDKQVCAEHMQERQVEGIAALTFGIEEQLANSPIDLPVVYAGADHDLRGVRNVRINYLPGFKNAIKHLVDFGHQRIGYLSGRMDWSSMRMRLEGLRKAMKLSGVVFDKELMVECDHTWEGGAQGMSPLLSLPKPPTAVLCCNDVAAMSTLKTLAARGLQADQDIALNGFDDLTICQFAQPPLTTIQFSSRELASLAFRALTKRSRICPRSRTSSTKRDSCFANPLARRGRDPPFIETCCHL